MRRSSPFSLFVISLCIFIATVCAETLSGQTEADDTCFMCHGREGSRIPFVDKETLQGSVHKRNRCISCHRDADSVPHQKDLNPVECSRCHSGQSGVYLNSRHGKVLKQGRSDSAVCSDCHGNGHEILSPGEKDSPSYRKTIIDTCARCHTDTERMASVRLAVKDPVGSYLRSVHGQAFQEGNAASAVCTDCHSAHDLNNSLNPESSIFRKNIPDTCGKCHREIVQAYKESVHGRTALEGATESPVCTDCHGGHAVLSTAGPGIPTEALDVTQTCAGCHESEQIIQKFDLPSDLLKTYGNSYHGLAARRGDMSVANCASCHGYHDVRPSDDPRSSIHKTNLPETCGRCHPGVGDRLSISNIHGTPASKHWSLMMVQWFYWIVIPMTVIVMLLHNGLDWIRKAWTGIRTAIHSEDIRLTINERWQHFILIASFVLLALSGFALKHPNALWAEYLAPSEETVRRALHRWTALVFTLLSLYHFLYIVFTKRGRFIIKEMMPHWADLKDMFSVLAYILRIRKYPPLHKGFYRYPEKIEYWSLVWGSTLMIVTGSILVFNEFTLKYFPLWVADLATLTHYYEATLACLAIVIWHFYSVIFDPDVYPMNCAWLNGRVRRLNKNRPDNRKIYFSKVPYGRF